MAAVSLAVSAWGTWKSAQVADDQLSQSRTAQDDALRHQISRITYWPEGDKVIVENRSYDTATADMGYGPLEGSYGLGVLSPCTRYSFPLSKLIPPAMVSLSVVDASGNQWLRLPSGRLDVLSQPSDRNDEDYGIEFGSTRTLHMDSEPAKGCG
ncbi:hypothetical protein [Streptomyces sp. NPDC002132]|uniref:hypothetical protein n=1 Tax=unclassified Streptomyces TaxID=2593676 RepID=UPI0033226757